MDTFLPVYNQKKGGRQKTPYLLSTKDFRKWSNEKAIDLGMGETCYTNCVPFVMDEVKQHLYMYNFNCLNPSPRMETKLNP